MKKPSIKKVKAHLKEDVKDEKKRIKEDKALLRKLKKS